MEHPVTWVKLEKYTELTGDSMDAVNARRKVGKWLDGNQCKIVDGRLWINIPLLRLAGPGVPRVHGCSPRSNEPCGSAESVRRPGSNT